jgi:hypothetical protein
VISRMRKLFFQYLGTQLGVMVLLTPKFHAELAGKGVHYSWAHAKAFYQRMPLSRKRGRDNFKQLVKDCTCPVYVLTKERLRSLLRGRGHIYVLTIILSSSISSQHQLQLVQTKKIRILLRPLQVFLPNKNFSTRRLKGS